MLIPAAGQGPDDRALQFWAPACGGERNNESRFRLYHGKWTKRHHLYRINKQSAKRVHEHREGLIEGFTKKYGCKLLVWFEAYDDLEEARATELRMKNWNRQWKLKRIERMNPDWNDLWDEIVK